MKLIQKLANLVQPRLYWKNIFNYYRDLHLFQKSTVQIINLKKERSVLVLCPHIDDDVIGLGGTLIQYRELGTEVTVIYFTTVNERRKREGETIASFMKYKAVSFHDFDVEQLSRYSEIQTVIRTSLKKEKYDIVYVPFHLDRHKDHIALSLHLAAVLKSLPELELEIRSYEVWSPLFPNQIVDISSVIDDKRKAISICQSQMETFNYVDMALSLNRYRGMSSTRERQMQYGEVFYSATPFTYLKVISNRN